MTIPAGRPREKAVLGKQWRRRRLLTLLAAVWIGLQAAGPAVYPAPPPLPPKPASGPVLKPVEAATLKTILKTKRGKVVLINLWATWCVPCREEFPDLIKLYGKYRDRGLELILISVDFAEQRPQVEAFLKENGVAFPTYINAEESNEDLIDFLAPDWIGGLPTTFVIDRKGRLTRSLVGGQNYEVFRKAVAPLLRTLTGADQTSETGTTESAALRPKKHLRGLTGMPPDPALPR